MTNLAPLYTPQASTTVPATALAKPKSGLLANGGTPADFWAAILGPQGTMTTTALTPVAKNEPARPGLTPIVSNQPTRPDELIPEAANPIAPLTDDGAEPPFPPIGIYPGDTPEDRGIPSNFLPPSKSGQIPPITEMPKEYGTLPPVLDEPGPIVERPIGTLPPLDDDVLPDGPPLGQSPKTNLIPVASNMPTPADQPEVALASALNAIQVGGEPAPKTMTKDKDSKTFDPVRLLMTNLIPEDGYDQTRTVQSLQPVAPQHPQTNAKSPVVTENWPTSIDPLPDDPALVPVFDHMPAAQTRDGGSGMLPGTTTTLTQTDKAAQTHHQTAVQAIATHLQNLANNRDPRSLTLQLNPPELGRMQIKMSYGRDKSVRADILVEKAETLQMMQKDTDSLKTALIDAGLQADMGSLNFNLAGDGTFADLSRDDTAKWGTNPTEDQGDVIGAYEIKSSEEWSVDPSTGIVRYTIWA